VSTGRVALQVLCACDHRLTLTACMYNRLQLKDNDLVLVSREAYFKVPHGSSIVINTTAYAGFYP
jgi:hypothetical protein